MNSGSMNRSSGNYRVLAEAVGRLGNEVLDWRDKSVPPMADGRSVADLVLARTSLAEWGTPLLTLDRGAIAQNVAVMAKWCSARGLELAPHGKTTMAPELFLAQLRAGAWGITLANEPQLRVGRAFGLPKILLAGSFLRPDGLRWLVAQQMADPDFRFSSWVDSVRSVELMTSALPAGSNIDVCVELGVDGGRTGARGVGAALEVARAVQRSSRLRLIGVSGYEGAVGQGAGADQIGAVDRYLDDIARVWTAVGPMVDLTTAGRAMITVGGSAYFDRVAAGSRNMPTRSESAGRPSKSFCALAPTSFTTTGTTVRSPRPVGVTARYSNPRCMPGRGSCRIRSPLWRCWTPAGGTCRSIKECPSRRCAGQRTVRPNH